MPIKIKAVIVTAFEPDSGPVPGEFHHFREREKLNQMLPFSAGYRPLCLNDQGILGVVTGVGAARAAASIMALGLDLRFDLTEALWLISGVAGINPAKGSLGSVVLPAFVVDGSFAHELDAREIPPHWPDGFVPIGKCFPYEQPLEARFNGDDGIVFPLDPSLVRWAAELTSEVALLDTEGMQERRRHFEPRVIADQTPRVLRGDELASTTFWHGTHMSRRAARWIEYETSGQAQYTITGMEDAGILQALGNLAAAGRINRSLILIARGTSNFDQQRIGLSAAESLAETKVTSYSAYLPALENAWRVGHLILKAWLER